MWQIKENQISMILIAWKICFFLFFHFNNLSYSNWDWDLQNPNMNRLRWEMLTRTSQPSTGAVGSSGQDSLAPSPPEQSAQALSAVWMWPQTPASMSPGCLVASLAVCVGWQTEFLFITWMWGWIQHLSWLCPAKVILTQSKALGKATKGLWTRWLLYFWQIKKSIHNKMCITWQNRHQGPVYQCPWRNITYPEVVLPWKIAVWKRLY